MVKKTKKNKKIKHNKEIKNNYYKYQKKKDECTKLNFQVQMLKKYIVPLCNPL